MGLFSNAKKAYSNFPLNVVVTQSGANELTRITFNGFVGITFIYVRLLPANGELFIFSNEHGERVIQNTINGIYVFSVGASVGAPTINRVANAIQLNQANNFMLMDGPQWQVNNLFIQCSQAGQYIVNFVYKIV